MEKRPLTFTLFLLRLLSGITGGIGGTLVALVLYFIMLYFVPVGGEVTSLSAFAIIIMVFVATLSANTLTAAMVTFMDNEKYSRRKTTITHVFLFNLILFILTIPLYIIGISLDISIAIAALHFLLSAFISALIMEVLAGYEYSLLGIYSSALGIYISIAFAFIILIGDISQALIIFGAMPAVWFILQTVSGFVELVYDNFLRLYGVDALNVQTDLGGDTEVEKDEDEEEDTEGETGDED